MRWPLGDDPARRQVPPLHLRVPDSGVAGIDQVEVGALPVPHLPSGVPGIGQDRRDRPQRPPRAGAVRVASRVGGGRARDRGVVQGARDPGGAVPGQPLREHPPHHRRCGRVRLQAVCPPAPRRVRLVRMRPGISQPVSVWRSAAQVPTLLPGLGGHRSPHPDPGPGDLPLRRQPERQHGLLVILGVPVHRAADLGHPQLDPVMLQQRRHRRVLAAVERPLVLPDHDRVPAAVRVRQLRDQSGGLRSPGPRQGPGFPAVEELGRNRAVPGRQNTGLLPLPRPRRHRVLLVLGRHPPVKREPQPAAAPHVPAATSALVQPP
jgi:hypothetical protein